MRVSIKSLREIHNLGSATREWMVSSERVPGYGKKHVRIAGWTEAGRGYRFVRHDPPFAVILVTERGEGRAWVDGEWRAFPAGYAYITSPRAPSAYHIKPGCTWRLHWVIYWEETLLPSLESGRAPRLVPVEATGLRQAIEGCCHEKGTKADPGVLGLWAALIDRAVLRILDADKGDPRLDRLWLAIREDIGGKWNLTRMARCVGLSEESLRRLCQRHLKRSPMAQLTRMRMNTAADILQHTEEKLASLAALLGYADAFSFSTAFKRTLGKSPHHFRTSCREPKRA